jgi:thymidylate kinase
MYMGGCNEPDPGKLSRFIRAIYSGIEARIIFVEAKPAIAFERIKSREDGHSRLDLLTDADLRTSLERTAELPRRIIAAAAAAGLQVVTVDGSAPIDLLVQELKPLFSSTEPRS